MISTLAALVATVGCRPQEVVTTVEAPAQASQIRTLDENEEATLATLLADDPGDYQALRARIWRYGPLRWVPDGPAAAPLPLGAGDLPEPIDAIVLDPEGPKLLLPLAELDEGRASTELVSRADERALPLPWRSLRLIAIPRVGDLISGLRRELRPTPWLTVAAGVAVSPVDRETDSLKVRWRDPDCGFGLQLAIDPEDFGPLYEPGPAGTPSDPAPTTEEPVMQLIPGSPVFPSSDARQPVLTMDDEPDAGERLGAAARVSLDGQARGGRQPIVLRCRGVEVHGWVASRNLRESPARYSVLDRAQSPVSSSCEALRRSPTASVMRVPAGTPLFEPKSGEDAALIGAVIEEVELLVESAGSGWWQACVPSPWGDLGLRFRPRY
ncbi:hypothetical protein G6O69_13660 [Pseudenhygromyxa sp. WMMC2535]|uniref:hypothetical protein n=1 Tax=Pseudenhygromyxa sp. WMMC2535 TaxID=2712867 RepID=UPI001555E2D9|nr:hypothetical protein [Pseudenhygromyxa sp. WMMC2535]NVB38883.1 hypothetical protein [Pseudenhygromyxa sp. WMMC2535]